MLVLSRHKEERIIIPLEKLIPLVDGDTGKLKQILSQPIEINICDIRGDKVRLGFEAAVEIPVHRLEVWESIKRGNTCMAKRW
jgi:carbon storage regulator CsrA